MRATRVKAALAMACLATAAMAAKASAAKPGGTTTLAPDPAALEALSAEGVAVAPSGAADLTGKGIAFPITGGKANLDKPRAKIDHSGGLTFSEGATSLTVENFVVKVGKKNIVKAEVAGGGGKVVLADLGLENAEIVAGKKKVVISGVDVLLAEEAAGALAATFGLPDLTGADIGDATVKLKP
jgi:hypothetical protein